MYMHQWGEQGMWNAGLSAGGQEWVLLALALAIPFIIVAAAWSVVWKGLALWHSARRGQYWWFMILLVVNTLGILEIIYLFAVAKLRFKDLFTLHSHNDHHAHH